MRIKTVLLDTSFLITFLDAKRPNHVVAKQYFRHFLDNGFVLWLSTIVASEYCHKATLDELPMLNLRVLPFGLKHAVASAELNFQSHRHPGRSRDHAKDDFKLLGQAQAEEADFLITDDSNTLFVYAQKLSEAGDLNCRSIRLADGFDVALVNDDRQCELPDSAE
jgi:predicted nucleic acid-binding protein